jgi:hypothetical protein
MGQVNSIISLVIVSNIDCKRIMFKGEKPDFVDGKTIYYDADLLIIKNALGRDVFNSLVSRFHWHNNKTALDEIENYPVYAVTFDMFSGGHHYGKWRYFDDYDSLAENFEADTMADDFERFKSDMEQLIAGEPSE